MRDQLWDRLGALAHFFFNLVLPQTIPQLSARLLSPRLPLFSKVGYVIAPSAVKKFGNDVCKCSTIRRAIFLGNLQKLPVKLWVMPGYRKGAFNTMLLHLKLTCITITVGQLITFSVKLYYIYGGVSYHIQGWFLLHLRLVLHLELIFITFAVGIIFSVVITFSGDSSNILTSLMECWCIVFVENQFLGDKINLKTVSEPFIFPQCTISLRRHILSTNTLYTFKIIHGLCPAYLSSLLQQYHPQRSLRSSSKLLFTVPTVNSVTYSERAFSLSAPILWNSLPDSVNNTTSLSSFKSALKTFSFRKSYFWFILFYEELYFN